ncbi:MAG TPA: ATP-binding protein [Anaeromyxobacteraceae bacterium]|nr:ATP-binding protein [Anaeromyxobacteraceae bacterium]
MTEGTPRPEPQPEASWSRSLQARVFMLLGLGVLGPTAIGATALYHRLQVLDERQMEGRLHAATAVAGQLDEELTQSLESLQRAATAHHVDLRDGDANPEKAALREAALQGHFPAGAFMLDAAGGLVAEVPERGERSLAPPAGTPEVQEVLRTGRPAVSSVVASPLGDHVYAMVPVRDWRGEITGLAGGVLDLSQHHYTTLLRFLKRYPEAAAEVVDGAGKVVASAEGGHPRRLTECRHVAKVVAERRSLGDRCHTCHPRLDEPDFRSVLAVAPLKQAPWGVTLRQPEREVLATVGAFPVGLLGLEAALLCLGALFAWGAARSVTRPVAALTAAAEQIAEGDLAQPVPQAGPDEVGRLAHWLEVMRWSLREMLAYVEQANQRLERRVEERTAELARVNAELRQREQELARLYEKVLTAQEDERRRIARELHDETSQSLAVLVMGLDGALAAIRAGQTPRLDEVKALAVRTIEEVHRLILDLRPSVLDDLGLLSAIRWYGERYLQPRGISVRCEFEKLERRLPPAFETAVFRVCQEAMTNIARHAEAETVLVQAQVEGDALAVEIEDDGRGFDPAEVARRPGRPHFGLLGIRERVELLGGKLTIDSAPGRGTRLHLEVPLPEEARS